MGEYEKWTWKWGAEWGLRSVVFGITGTTTMLVVRPTVTNILHLEGSFKEGPWSYRLCSIIIMMPVYHCCLLGVGTVFGRYGYFSVVAKKGLGRFGITW